MIEKICICRSDTTGISSEVVELRGGALLEVERSSSIAYLDLELSFGRRWSACGCLDVKTHFKPTAIKTPLSFDSAHRFNCKAWWPLAEARRFARTCSDYSDWKRNIDSLTSRISDYPQAIRQKMRDPAIHLRRAVLVNGRVRRGCVLSTNRTQRLQEQTQQRTCVAKFRSDESLQRIEIQNIFDRNAYHLGDLQNVFRARVCWQNHDKHLRLALRRTWPKM